MGYSLYIVEKDKGIREKILTFFEQLEVPRVPSEKDYFRPTDDVSYANEKHIGSLVGFDYNSGVHPIARRLIWAAVGYVATKYGKESAWYDGCEEIKVSELKSKGNQTMVNFSGMRLSKRKSRNIFNEIQEEIENKWNDLK